MKFLLTFIALVSTAAGAPGARQQPFRAGVDLVHLTVVVTDKQGAPITGLSKEDFAVVESGTPQAIALFAAGAPADAPPLHLGFLLDASGSMSSEMADVRTAAIKFLNAMDEAVDVTLVDFDTQVNVARYAADEYPRLIERIRGRKADGYTALYDALGVYLHHAAGQDGEKILVMYTDGGDTRSALQKRELVDLLKASDATVYAIGYLEQYSSASRLEPRMELERFAGLTGGQAFFPSSVKEVDKMYEKIQREIAARYTIGYTSTDTRTDGAWRPVEVRLTRKDLKGVKLRTRGGYFAPYRK